MRGRLLFVAGAALGFVIGARRGRPAYDRLAGRASDAIHSPRVQRGLSDVQEFVKEHVPVVGEQLADAVDTAQTGIDTEAGRTTTRRPVDDE